MIRCLFRYSTDAGTSSCLWSFNLLLLRLLEEISLSLFFLINFIYLLIYYYYYFLVVLDFHFCAWAFCSCGKWEPLFIAVHGPLTVTASLVAEQRLQTRKLSSCGSRAQLLRGMWDLPRPGLEPVSPAFAGRFSTTAPRGKPPFLFVCTAPVQLWIWTRLCVYVA